MKIKTILGILLLIAFLFSCRKELSVTKPTPRPKAPPSDQLPWQVLTGHATTIIGNP